MATRVLIISSGVKFRKFGKGVKKTVVKILKILKKENIELEICLAGNKQMKALNKKFRKKNKPANVLSFREPEHFIYPKQSIGGKIKKIGEIYLNMENKDKIFSKEILLAHGILHLFGYEHKTKTGKIKMDKKEKFITANF